MDKKELAERDKRNKKLGKKGEKLAAKYLKKQGYKILKKNFKNPFGEIDIIARQGDVVAFIEVKTRLSDIFGVPSEAVTRDKCRKYALGAKFFFAERNVACTIRFDIIEIFNGEVNHIISAFEGR
ncbi:MAG: YraN family protein [Clostridia bacterium]|nr:YraN family protein [Clostridia bacterium]